MSKFSSIKDLSPEEQLSFILRVFKAFDDADNHEELWWRANEPQYEPVKLFVRCNDLFHWACADLEEITPSNIELLESTFAELIKLDDMERLEFKKGNIEVNSLSCPNSWAGILFCCRSRGMRPQTPYYKYIPSLLHHLFNACGPERTDA